MQAVTSEYTLRLYTPADEEPSRVLANAVEANIGGLPTSSAQWRAFLETPRLEPERNIAIVTDEAGNVVGMSDMDCEFNHSDGVNDVWADCSVDPALLGRGIGTMLIRWGEARALELADERAALNLIPANVPVRQRRSTPAHQVEAVALLQANGYAITRSFYRMKIMLADWDETPPALPAGLELRPMNADAHGYTVYEAQQDIWRDHWGFEPENWEYWRQMVIERPEADLSLWQIAWDTSTNQIAAIAVNRPYSNEGDEAGIGWVGMLGTRRAYRKQGIGRALLLRSFAAFKRAGFREVMLGVDAASQTGALTLYQNAGMHMVNQRDVYEKRLR